MTAYREQARLFRLMSHPMRLQILNLVRSSDECVCHLSAALRKPQPYVSQQLALLRKEGLILDRKDGNNVYYGLAGCNAAEQVEAILSVMEEGASIPSASGHQMVAGCVCPKCEPPSSDGTPS